MRGDPRGVFYDLHNDEQAADLTARANLMIAIENRIKGLSRAEAAQRLGVTQSRVSDLLDGKLSEFSLDALTELAG
ncbi:helix-turn-helix domain-containing protein [Mycolicibacterium septicum]|uniref:Helix-turn-helix domain-containing protein n=1 Tax=Mycolicibacterium septicum TaxID=98668 RepID=A0ABW9LTU8_9MYCO